MLAAASHGDGGAVDQMRWVLGWSRNPAEQVRRVQSRGARHRHVRGREGARAAGPRLVRRRTCATRQRSRLPSTAASKPTATEEFWTTLTAPGGVAKARQIYDEATKAGRARRSDFRRPRPTCSAIELLQDGNAKDAVEVFKLNVDAYPASANTYDSLSDGYLALGNREEALRYAEKALEMMPKDAEAADDFKTLVRESAETKIKELKK